VLDGSSGKVLRRMKERFYAGLLLAVAMLVYGDSLENDFTQDDELYVVHNETVTSPSIRGLFEPNRVTNVFRPVTFSTFALNWAARGARPFGYHLVNLLLHAAVTLLLYLLLEALLEPRPQARTVAFVAALLFAVHPIHAEAVASVVGRSELLAGGFLLAAWLLHLRDRQISALICFLLALLSKESAVVFLPLTLIGDYARGKMKPLSRYGWITGLTVLYLGVLWRIDGGRFGQTYTPFLDNPLVLLPTNLRILNALRVAWKYVGLHVYPATLSCDYSYDAITLYSNWQHTIPPAVAAAILLALWVWALWTKRSEWALAGAIYLAGFAVTANVLIPTGTIMGERLAYLPSAGFCLLVALMWTRLENYNRKVAWGVFIILGAALAVRTVVRNRDWRDEFTLYSAGVRAVPGSAKMHEALAVQYMHRDQLETARNEFETALRIYPDFTAALESYGILEARMGHDQDSLRLLEKAMSNSQRGSMNYDFAMVNLAAQLMKLEKNDEALKLLNQDISESPGFARAWSNRAVLRYKLGEMESARADAQTALRLDPANTQALNLLSLLNSTSPAASSR
jgi:Tfp pilus assembly protein PilF